MGKVGVAIDSLADMRLLLAGLPLDKVTTSMTINATAAILLLFYQLVAEENGVDPKQLGGTIQNDILKEYVARGTYIYPPRPSMRLVTDTFSYCAENLPAWNTISISGYHIREAGSTAVQEIAFTIANGIAYVEAALAAGLDVDAFAPRLSFFWNAHNNLFEEVAKYRAARRMWAKIMTERFGAKDEKSTLLRFHTQTGGSTLTAQQPENNIVRVTVQAMAAALGGTQSLHTNGFDEALGLPTEKAAKIALRTQQIVGYESGIADTVDPLAGSWFVESLTDEVERAAWEYLERIDDMGGAVDAIEAQYMQQEIEQAAYAYAKAIDNDEKIVIGVNKFVDATNEPTEVFPIDVELQRSQIAAVKKVKADRDQAAVDAALADVEAAARGTQNLLVPMKVALRSGWPHWARSPMCCAACSGSSDRAARSGLRRRPGEPVPHERREHHGSGPSRDLERSVPLAGHRRGAGSGPGARVPGIRRLVDPRRRRRRHLRRCHPRPQRHHGSPGGHRHPQCLDARRRRGGVRARPDQRRLSGTVPPGTGCEPRLARRGRGRPAL